MNPGIITHVHYLPTEMILLVQCGPREQYAVVTSGQQFIEKIAVNIVTTNGKLAMDELIGTWVDLEINEDGQPLITGSYAKLTMLDRELKAMNFTVQTPEPVPAETND